MSKEAMKRFLIETPVENAEGSQTWYVDATSEAEALKKYEQGGCDLYASNVDVTSLGEPEISGETTLDNFGDFAEQPVLRPCRSPYCECSVGQCSHPGFYDARGEPLPPAHRTWVGLTKDEVFAVSNTMPYGDRFDFAEAIEAKLKEKNNG